MANGWTPERKARQAEMIRIWKPWEQSTGPMTNTGKAVSGKNAFVQGAYSREVKAARKRFNDLLRQCKDMLEVTR